MYDLRKFISILWNGRKGSYKGNELLWEVAKIVKNQEKRIVKLEKHV